MADNIQRGEDGLPVTTDKELAAMDKLFCDEQYQIKEPAGFLRFSRKDIVNPYFVMRALDELVRHIHEFMSSVRKMIPAGVKDAFLSTLRAKNPAAEEILSMVLAIEIKALNEMLNVLQKSPRTVSVAELQPFIKTLYKPLIRIYYLEPEYVSSCIMEACRLAVERFMPSSGEALRSSAFAAVQEAKYIYNKVFPLTYPIVLRMVSPVMMNERDLFYKNGSKVLDWLDVHPDEIIFPDEGATEPPADTVEEEKPAQEKPQQVPKSVSEGLAALERLFPQAGWEKILKFPEEKSDFAPYFAGILMLPETFVQLSPDHPLHFAMILFYILSELIQGVRHVNFSSDSDSDTDSTPSSGNENIYAILDDWAMYGDSVFDKTFGDDLKAYTHQVYSQPDFARSNYATRLVASMYSVVRQYFLPFYNMRFYPFQRVPIDRLPAFYPRVRYLCEMLEASIKPSAAGESGFDVAKNASSVYRFDIPNVSSRHLDALCGGGRSRRRTNEVLIRYCASILSVLDWWINDKDSPAYKATSPIIYRTSEEEPLLPSFAIDARKDTEEIFRNSLKKGDPNTESNGA